MKFCCASNCLKIISRHDILEVLMAREFLIFPVLLDIVQGNQRRGYFQAHVRHVFLLRHLRLSFLHQLLISLISKRVSMSLSSPLLPSGGKGPPTEGQDSIVTTIFAPAILAILSGDERGRCRYSHGVRTHSAQIHVIILHLHA
jgi:hypothetical protein